MPDGLGMTDCPAPLTINLIGTFRLNLAINLLLFVSGTGKMGF